MSNYAGQSCAELHEKKMQTQIDLGKAEKAQLTARQHDTVGVLLVGIPVSRLDGQGQDKEIARLKGESQAISAQQKATGCT